MRGKINRAVVATAAALMLALPAAAMAQDGGGRRAGGGGAGGMADMRAYREAVDKLDLTGDKKTKVDDVMTQAQTDAQAQMQGLRDATPEERQDKMKAAAKVMTDARAKIDAELTPEQRATLASSVGTTSVTRASTMLAAERKAVDGLDDLDADKKKQVVATLDEATKTVDGLKAEAATLKDNDGLTAFGQKLQAANQKVMRTLVEEAGQDDARTVMRAGAQATRGANGGRRATSRPAN